MKWKGLAAAAAAVPAATLLAAAAPEVQARLDVDPELFSGDQCLAPDFEGEGCPRRSDLSKDPRLTASAALLAPDLPDPAPLLALDMSVLREGAEVTPSG
ncbi:MAG TPA: hypothetical protein VF662_00400 [Allosphingosinicella sp.]|jgi:hypothetical protein